VSTDAVRNSAVDEILVASGIYSFATDMRTDSAICVDCAVTIKIKSGGTAGLIGLNITGGYAAVSSGAVLVLFGIETHFLSAQTRVAALSNVVDGLHTCSTDLESIHLFISTTHTHVGSLDSCYFQARQLGVMQQASSTHPLAAHVLMRPPGNNRALTQPCVGDRWPAEVLHLQRVLVVRASDIVAELVGVLGLDAAARVAAAQEDLPTPHAPRAALCEHVVFGAEEKLRDESSTDPVVPRGRCYRQRTAPNGTDVLHVIRVVHVQPGQRCAALGAGDLPQVDPRAIGARRAVELPLATKLARHGRQRAEELCLVLVKRPFYTRYGASPDIWARHLRTGKISWLSSICSRQLTARLQVGLRLQSRRTE